MKTREFVSDEEIIKLGLALKNTKGSVTESDLLKVIQWAQDVRLDQALLKLVLSGEVKIRVESGELVYFKASLQ